MKISRLSKIGIFNTIRLNYHYFGLDGIRHLYFLASRNLKILSCKGSVIANCPMSRGMIQIGFNDVTIFDKKYERSIWKNDGNIYLDGHVTIGHGGRISNSGNIYFGKNFILNANSTIACQNEIRFGADNLVSWDCLIMDTDFHKIMPISRDTVLNAPKRISIGNHVWIGCRTTILKGSSVKDNSVIAAGSIITSDFDENNIIIGGVNRVLNKNITWDM